MPLRLKVCGTCAFEELPQRVAIEAVGEEIRFSLPSSGRVLPPRTVKQLHVSLGARLLSTSGAMPVDFPLEIRARGSRLELTMVMPFERYVQSALQGEMSGIGDGEALKAMAVAARTYAVRFRGKHAAEGFDFCDTTHCQDIRLAQSNPQIQARVAATEGELLWFRGSLAESYYHRHCGGATEAADVAWPSRGKSRPYLKQMTDTFCTTRGRNEWHSTISKNDLQRALLAARLWQERNLKNVEVVRRTTSGRVARLRIRGTVQQMISADAFRLAVGRALGWEKIRSDLYEVREAGENLIFDGRGAGHGVGLCQLGAVQMAADGRGYRQILNHYYPGTEVGLNAQGIAWNSVAGERVELLTTRPPQDQWLIAIAERELRDAETRAGWDLIVPRPGNLQAVQLRVYPDVAMFRDSTGAPGWIAAITRGTTIRMQPAETLRAAGTLDETLRHEFLHMLIDQRAKKPLPLWLREGLVLVLAGTVATSAATPAVTLRPFENDAQLDRAIAAPQSRTELRNAYRAARARVEELIRKHGRDTIIGWLDSGLPK
jgi:stage II sporulation protein D